MNTDDRAVWKKGTVCKKSAAIVRAQEPGAHRAYE